MSSKTYEQQFKALASRLRFIQKRVWDLEKNDDRQAINDTMCQLRDQIEAYFGNKIAREMFWSVKEK